MAAPTIRIRFHKELINRLAAMPFARRPIGAGTGTDGKPELIYDSDPNAPSNQNSTDWVLRDEELRGFGFRIQKGVGSKTRCRFIVQRKKGGSTSHRYVIQTNSLKEARAKAQEWLDKMRRDRTDPRQELDEHRARIKQAEDRQKRTFLAVFQDYIPQGHTAGKRKSTVADRALVGRWLVRAPFAQTPIHLLDIDATQGHFKDLFAKARIVDQERVAAQNAAAAIKKNEQRSCMKTREALVRKLRREWQKKHDGTRATERQLMPQLLKAWEEQFPKVPFPEPRKKRTGLGVGSVHKMLRQCKACWRWSKDEKTTHNPFVLTLSDVPRVPIRKGGLIPTDDKSKRWLRHVWQARKSPAHRVAVTADYLILDVMWGVRKTQMLVLRWRNIDLEKGLVTFPPETTKGGREQIIPFGPLAKEILEARRARTGKTNLDGTLAKPKSGPVLPTGDDDWVFISTKLSTKEETFNGHKHIVEVRHVLDSAEDEAGLSITSHDLRRTFGSITFLHTGSVQAVAAALSHSTGMATTEGYIQTMARVEEARPRFLILEHVIGTMIGLPRLSQSIAAQSPAASAPVSTLRSSAREAELEAIAEAALRDPRLRDTFLYMARNAKRKPRT